MTNKKLLEGIKIADFMWAAVGPLTIKTFADYGAEVIQIEGRTRNSGMRVIGPYKNHDTDMDLSGSWNQWDTSKMDIAINLSKPKGVEIAKKIVAWADIVADNFNSHTMEKMGLGYEELKKIKPDIIMLSSCMMGQTGPYSRSVGYGGPLTALSGFRHITGWPDLEPIGPAGAYTDFIAPHFNTLALLAALEYRRRTGKGQYLDLSQYENGVHFMSPLILDYNVNGRVADRMGNRLAYAAPHGAYRCQGDDRWCAIAVFTDEEWASFCKVIGNPEWTDDPKFSTLVARKENEDELDRLVEDWTIHYAAEEVMNLMQKHGVPAGVLQNAEDLQEHDPQLKHRNLYRTLSHPKQGKYVAPRPVFMASKCTCDVQRAPLLGEHNEYVMKEILGISDKEISELVVEGVLE
jgi:benzylsuccinate CoA-transferase BbsF subunit